MTNDRGQTIQATQTSLRIVHALRDLDGARVSELANELDMPASTVHSHLSTLSGEGYVVKEGDEYQLGLLFLNLGEYVRKQKEAYQLAENMVEQLVDETDGWAHFVVEEHGRGIYLYSKSGEHPPKKFSDTGETFHLHAAAAGKAILAHESTEKVESIIDRWGLPQLTENTITDEETLLSALTRVRETGIAFNDEEQFEGVRAVGAPVLTDRGEVIGAFSVSGPTHRMKGDWYNENIPDVILGTANELEITINYL